MSVVGLSILGMSLVWCRFCGLVGSFCSMMRAVFLVLVDWSTVRRDEDGDWFAHDLKRVPNEVPVYNTQLTEGEWRDIATFAGAVAAAMRGEAIDRQMRIGRLKDFVAGRIASSTAIPYTLADMAIDAVCEFEKENPVD